MMATHDEMVAIVARGVEAYAQAEQACDAVDEAMRQLKGVYQDAAAAGMMTGGEAEKELALFKRISGLAGQMEELIYAAHNRGTAIAKRNGADVALPNGFVTIMSGGR